MPRDDYIVEDDDDFAVMRRRKGPREAPATAAEPPPTPPSPDETPPVEPASEEAAWLLGSAAEPTAAPAVTGADETHEPSRQYGGEAAGARDPAALEDSPLGSLLASPARSTRPNRTSESRGTPMHLAIAATEFNYDITSMMLERAHEHARFLGAEVTHVVRVPGVYDLPFAVQRLMRRDDVDGVITLGCVIEGETDHDDLVIQHAARKIVDLSLAHDKPVGLGITGPGMSRMQAMARIDRAKDAVEAAVRMHRDLAGL